MEETSEKEVQSVLDLKDFKFHKILFNNAAKRTAALLGEFPQKSETDKAVVIVEKVEFTEENFASEDDNKAILKHTRADSIILNDVYFNFLGTAERDFNSK